MVFPSYTFIYICLHFLPAVLAQNLTDLPRKFHPESYFSALTANCDKIAAELQKCPLETKNSSKQRFRLAERYSECLATEYGDHFACSKPYEKLRFLPVEAFPAMYRTQGHYNYTKDAAPWNNFTAPNYPTNSTCKLPDIVPIMRKACEYDIQSVENSTCCANGYSSSVPCGKLSFNLLACTIQSVRTYIGCTARTAISNSTDITQCVVDTAPRINFVPIGFQVDSNGNSCPAPNETIYHLGRVTIVEFLLFLVFENYHLWVRLWRRFVRGEHIPVRSTQFRANALSLWATIAKDICEQVVIVGILLLQQGYQEDLFKSFVLFSVRPRAAFFNALLGYIDAGWAHDGLIDMVAQILLSIFGGYFALFGAISANHTLNPARPDWWKTYLAGGALASLVTDCLLLYVAIMLLALGLIFCGGWAVIMVMMVPPFWFVWKMVLYRPVKEIGYMGANVYRMMARKPRIEDPSSLFTFGNRLLSIWYVATMCVSLILFIGCWMFWVGFLRLSGELYCPQDLGSMDITMIGFYAAVVLVRKLLAFLQGEHTVNQDGAMPLGDMTPAVS